MRIDICLATYNGSSWIKEFLNSLDAQTYRDWRLVVSDDASQDDTIELINAHFINNPEKLVVVNRERG
jgi:glycosyltransferase involved in cell wall biosynthesis